MRRLQLARSGQTYSTEGTMRNRSRSVDLLCLGFTLNRRLLRVPERRRSVFYTDHAVEETETRQTSSMKDSGLRCRDSGLRSRDSGLHSKDCGLHSRDCGLHCRDCGLRSKDCDLHSKDSGICSRDCGLHSRDCGLHSKDCGLHRRNCGLHNRDSALLSKDAGLHSRNSGLQNSRGARTKGMACVKTTSTPNLREQCTSDDLQCVSVGIALCDNNPSPYDREGLPFRAGDRIQILAMNPSGLWRGRVHGREGIFKFIRVKLLDGEPRRKLSVGWEEGGNRSAPSYLSLGLVLANAGLAHLAPKLILNGYESVADLLELTREDLGYLDITDEEHGSCCASAVSLLDRLTASSRSVDNIDDCQNGIGGTSDQSESDLKSRDTASSLASKTSSEDDLAGDKNSSAAPSLLAKDGVSQWPWQESFLFRHLQQTVTIRL